MASQEVTSRELMRWFFRFEKTQEAQVALTCCPGSSTLRNVGDTCSVCGNLIPPSTEMWEAHGIREIITAFYGVDEPSTRWD